MSKGRSRCFNLSQISPVRLSLLAKAAAFGVALSFSACSPAVKKAQIQDRADRYFQAGEYDAAKIEYLALLKLDPERSNVLALQRLGSIWLEQGAPLEAYPFLLRAREIAPDNLEVRTNIARVLAFLGATKAARDEARIVLQQSPGQEETLLVLVDSVRSEEDAAEAKEQLRKVPDGNEFTYHLASASLAAREGDLGYAHSELQEALKIAPKSARAHQSMAELYSLQHKLTEAREEFRVAAGLSPARSSARLRYADFERQTGNTEEAVLGLQRVVKETPDYLPAWCLLAEITLSQGKLSETLALLKNVFARDPTNPDGQVLESRALLEQGETSKALEKLTRLTEIYPHVPIIEYHFARANAAAGNLIVAASALEDVLVVRPDYPEAILLKAEVDLRRDKPSLAIPALSKLIMAEPGLVSAYILLAQAYRASGRLDDAATTIREQISLTPSSSDCYFRLGLVLREQRKLEEARRAFEHVTELSPRDLDAMEQLVELDLGEKKFDGALHTVNQEFAQEPNSPEASYLKGKIYGAQGDWDHAELSLRAALKSNPNFSRAFDLLVSTYVLAGKLDEAKGELQTFLSKNPGNITALTTLARVHTLAKDYVKAGDAYEKLLSFDPGSVRAMNNLAYIYAEFLNQADQGCELARKARALRPGDPLIADTLGWALYKKGNYGEALAMLRESFEKLPDDADVQLHFGMANYMMFNSSAALTAFQKALGNKTKPSTQTDVPEAQRRVAFLERDTANALSAVQLNEIVREQPRDVVGWMRLAQVEEGGHAFEKSAAAYQEAFKINPELVPAAIKLARLYSGPLEDKNMAFFFAKKARDLAPTDPEAAAVLGAAATRLGDLSSGYALLQESARKLNSDPNVLQDYAWSAYLLGKIDESRALMKRIADLNQDAAMVSKANLFLKITSVQQDANHSPVLEREVDAVLREEPSFIPALLVRAAIRTEGGDNASAVSIYTDLLRRYPEFPLAEKKLAALYVDDPQHIDEAYRLATNARSLLADDAELANILGEISFKRGEFPYAIQYFQEGARRQPLSARGLYYCGMAQLRMSHDSESRETLEKALSLGLAEPMLQDAQKAIDELRRRNGP